MSAIPLADALLYLRIDEASPLVDQEIQTMLDAAEQFISRKTGHYFQPTDREYYESGDGCVRIYDTPVNFTTGIPDVIKNKYLLFKDPGPIQANVGYATYDEIPKPLIQAALMMLKVWYYESEKQIDLTLFPPAVKESIHLYRRFLI